MICNGLLVSLNILKKISNKHKNNSKIKIVVFEDIEVVGQLEILFLKASASKGKISSFFGVEALPGGVRKTDGLSSGRISSIQAVRESQKGPEAVKGMGLVPAYHGIGALLLADQHIVLIQGAPHSLLQGVQGNPL